MHAQRCWLCLKGWYCWSFFLTWCNISYLSVVFVICCMLQLLTFSTKKCTNYLLLMWQTPLSISQLCKYQKWPRLVAIGALSILPCFSFSHPHPTNIKIKAIFILSFSQYISHIKGKIVDLLLIITASSTWHVVSPLPKLNLPPNLMGLPKHPASPNTFIVGHYPHSASTTPFSSPFPLQIPSPSHQSSPTIFWILRWWLLLPHHPLAPFSLPQYWQSQNGYHWSLEYFSPSHTPPAKLNFLYWPIYTVVIFILPIIILVCLT